MPVESLGEAERSSMQALEPALRTHLEVSETAFNLVGTALGRIPEMPAWQLTQAQKVVNVLLIRLANDLRTAALLAVRGYAVQANTVASSMFEVAYTIAFIGASENLAQEWIDHDDPMCPFKPVKKLVKAVVHKLQLDDVLKLQLDDPKAVIARQRQVYAQLCMAKHANPAFQKEHGTRLEGNEWVSAVGPDHSQPAVRAAWFALEHGTGLVTVALMIFVREMLEVSNDDELLVQLIELQKARRRLSEMALDRFGTEDPFAGKWRV